MSPKVDGIYDIRTIEQLLLLGVRRFTFDMRPRSLNFIQHYRVIEMVKTIGLRKDIVFCFHFENEHPMLVQKFIDDLAAQAAAAKDDWTSGRLELEFSQREDFEAMDDFNIPYRWHLASGSDWAKAARAKNMRGLVIPFEYLEDALENGSLYSLCNNLHTLFPRLEFHLARGWGANVFPTLLELFDFADVALPIDPNVEVCFRNVDQAKLASGIRPYLNTI